MKPGKPLSFGVRGATLVFGLPGNPVSSLVGALVFVRPALLRRQGVEKIDLDYYHGRTTRLARAEPSSRRVRPSPAAPRGDRRRSRAGLGPGVAHDRSRCFGGRARPCPSRRGRDRGRRGGPVSQRSPRASERVSGCADRAANDSRGWRLHSLRIRRVASERKRRHLRGRCCPDDRRKHRSEGDVSDRGQSDDVEQGVEQAEIRARVRARRAPRAALPGPGRTARRVARREREAAAIATRTATAARRRARTA